MNPLLLIYNTKKHFVPNQKPFCVFQHLSNYHKLLLLYSSSSQSIMSISNSGSDDSVPRNGQYFYFSITHHAGPPPDQPAYTRFDDSSLFIWGWKLFYVNTGA